LRSGWLERVVFVPKAREGTVDYQQLNKVGIVCLLSVFESRLERERVVFVSEGKEGTGD